MFDHPEDPRSVGYLALDPSLKANLSLIGIGTRSDVTVICVSAVACGGISDRQLERRVVWIAVPEISILDLVLEQRQPDPAE